MYETSLLKIKRQSPFTRNLWHPIVESALDRSHQKANQEKKLTDDTRDNIFDFTNKKYHISTQKSKIDNHGSPSETNSSE